MRNFISILILTLPILSFANTTIDSLEHEVTLKQTPLEKADVLNLIASEYQTEFKYDKSVSYLLKAILLLEEEDQLNYKRVSELKINIGNIYAYMFEYEVSTRYYLEAINCYDDNGGTTIKSGSYGNIALNYKETGDEKRATDYFYKAKNLIETNGHLKDQRDSSFLAFSYGNLALIYASEHNPDSTELYIEKYSRLINENSTEEKQLFLATQVEVYHLLGQLNEATDLLSDYKEEYGIQVTPNALWYHLISAKIELEKEMFDTVMNHLDLAESLALEVESKLDQIEILKLREKCHIGLGQFDLAFAVRDRHQKFSDSLINPQVLHKMFDVLKEQEVDYYKQKREVEELTLVKDSQIQQYTWLISLSVIGFITFLSGFVLYRNNRKKKISDVELYTAELEEKRLGHKLKYKSNELSNLALFISNNVDFISGIKVRLNQMITDSNRYELTNIIQFIEDGFDVEEEKRDLDIKIEKANSHFYQKLDELNFKLTKKDKKVCSLLVLNLSSKEISSILNVQVSSVEKNRYRLRKKLNLNQGDDLVRFLRLL